MTSATVAAQLEQRLRRAQRFGLEQRLQEHRQRSNVQRLDALQIHDGALAIKEADDLLRGLACPYAGPLQGNRDLQNERFTPVTDYRRASFAGLPLLWQHGKDASIGDEPIGRILSSSNDAQGVWINAALRRSSDYWRAIKQLLADGKLYLSSGANPISVAADGSIKVWSVKEVSLVVNPANPYAVAELATKAAPWMY